MNSMRPAEEIEKAIKRISNTLISVAEGYTAKDLLSDISQDYDIDGHDFASQCGFSSFEEFMASDLMKKYVKVERQEDGLLYKPAYDPCMQHILDEMLKSRSDVLRKKQIKESREAAKNAKNIYTNNPPVNLFRQFGLNNNNSFASSSNALNNQPRQQDLIQQPQLKPNGPVPLMSIPVQSLCREGENYRSSQHNNFTALQPRSTAFFNPHATTYSKADNSNSQTAFLPNKQIASKPAGIPARIEQVSGQSSARDMANHNRTGQHNIKAELLVDKKSNSSSSSNDFEIYNAPPETSKAVPISSTTKKQINSINWDLDEEEEQATQQSPKNHNPNNIMRKSSSSDEWDFGELEIRKTVTKPVPVAPSRTVASSLTLLVAFLEPTTTKHMIPRPKQYQRRLQSADQLFP
uniref:HTH OST-type domain-containing protein n=1 Tax=Ditylenchus dipsaci TaxID=166011 RepID=A0A915D3F6_9BILA